MGRSTLRERPDDPIVLVEAQYPCYPSDPVTGKRDMTAEPFCLVTLGYLLDEPDFIQDGDKVYTKWYRNETYWMSKDEGLALAKKYAPKKNGDNNATT